MPATSQSIYEALKKLFVTDKDGHITIDNASIPTTTDGLKASELSIEATSKHLDVDVKNYPATYPDTDTEPRNVKQWGGTAQTGHDLTDHITKLDVALSTLEPTTLGTSIVSGVKTVTLVATPEALPSNTAKYVRVQNISTNTKSIYVGDSAYQNFELNPLDSVGFRVSNSNLVYVRVQVAGEGAAYLVTN